MVQLNPFKWGKDRKRKKLEIKKLDRVASSRRTQGGAGIRRNKARQKLKEMGVESTAQKEQKLRKQHGKRKNKSIVQRVVMNVSMVSLGQQHKKLRTRIRRRGNLVSLIHLNGIKLWE